ncbi:unnamed protein product [Mytilus coruscus]|uniref:Uncharacterized protein n=1 Tax=Mytilus coruscus TaxID=42192 RepID=A0A6J8E6U2_MYTCO|nr:unnamed protein product [Mytilus coruscus]
MNANESDFGVSYTCIADIFSFDSLLDLDVLNLSSKGPREVEPSKRDVLISWNLASRRLLRLYFARIFPIPDCQIFHNGTSILQTPTTISERDGNFYNVIVSFTISVGNKRALPVCYDLRKEKSNHKILLVVLGILALVLLQCVLSRLITNPKQRQKRNCGLE